MREQEGAPCGRNLGAEIPVVSSSCGEWCGLKSRAFQPEAAASAKAPWQEGNHTA